MRRVLTIGSISQPTSCNQGQNFSIRCAAVPAPWKNQGIEGEECVKTEEWVFARVKREYKNTEGVVLLLPKEIIYEHMEYMMRVWLEMVNRHQKNRNMFPNPLVCILLPIAS